MSETPSGQANGPACLLRPLNAVTQAANIVGSCLIVGLVALITADVLGRNLFGTPVAGVPEIVSLSIVAIVFLQAPQALLAGRLTRSDGFITVVKARTPRIAAVLETLLDLIGAGVMLAILYAHWPILTRAIDRGDFVGAVGNFTAPTWPVKAMLAIGALLLALQFLARILRRFSK